MKEKKDVTRKILNQINQAIAEKNLSQSQILVLCKAKGYTISQSELSRLLSQKINLGAYQMIALSDVLGLEINDVMNLKKAERNVIKFSAEAFITNPKSREIKPYLGNYTVMFHSTDAQNEKLLRGRMIIYEGEQSVCCVAFSLDTGEVDGNGEQIFKKYNGQFFVSQQLEVAYCILVNNIWGEMCLVEFRHRSFLLNRVESRVGLALTSAAGESKRPATHKMLIYREDYKLSDKEEQMCLNMLRLNNNTVFIEKDEIEKICKTQEEKDVLDRLFSASPAIPYYTVNASILKAMNKKLSNLQIGRLLAVLNEYSDTDFVEYIMENDDGDIFNLIRNSKERKGEVHRT